MEITHVTHSCSRDDFVIKSFLTHPHLHKSPYRRIIMSRPIIIPTKPIPRIQLLTVILVRLNTDCRSKRPSKRIISIRLLHIAILVCHNPGIPLMILQIEMVLPIRETHIPSLIEQHPQHPVLIDRISTVIRC
ncbi:hypothetical protein SAMN05444349_14714 [Bacteroides faecichinchillae]|uniref:Uncharacterized protein n=1 Tax=Bacteroides faecichinchillae TaxID=871325 RepID=A0A1M5FPP5_9BACE|nr:hypothetical protein SAMN05444349_14714 [Bacteroides faecichinchillae]